MELPIDPDSDIAYLAHLSKSGSMRILTRPCLPPIVPLFLMWPYTEA